VIGSCSIAAEAQLLEQALEGPWPVRRAGWQQEDVAAFSLLRSVGPQLQYPP